MKIKNLPNLKKKIKKFNNVEIDWYKIIVSVSFGIIGFFFNLINLSLLEFPNYDFKISILPGIFFPLLISLAWNWKYGLLSALFGGCQTMWYLWYADGYGFLYSVPIFTIWIVWHGYWKSYRDNNLLRHWYQSKYVFEIIFRFISEIGFYTVFRLLISFNPPFWDDSLIINTVTTEWINLVVIKHIITGLILLLIGDILLNLKIIRTFFKLSEQTNQQKTSLIISMSILFAILFWFFMSLIIYFVYNESNYDFLTIVSSELPEFHLFGRVIIVIIFLTMGLISSKFLKRKKEWNEIILKSKLKMIESQKMDSIGNLTEGIAHDFNNKLTAIIGCADLLLIEEEDIEKREFIKTIITESKDAAKLARNLLTFGRRKNTHLLSLNLNSIIEKNIEILKRTISKSIKIDFIHENQDLRIDADKSKINQIIMNLAINAAESMPNGGLIKILTKKYYPSIDNPLFSEMKEKEYIKLQISDTGYGIKPDFLKKIFKPFFTTKNDVKSKGTGLGLSIVKSIIENYNGIIDVKSKVNYGSIFTIYLPAGKIKSDSDSNYSNKTKKKKPNIEALKGKSFLIIDDEVNIRELISLYFKKHEIFVSKAKNGIVGIEILENNPKKYNLIILDLNMPQQNGKETLIKIKKINPEIPIIIITGYAKNKMVEEIKNIGVECFLYKPFSIYELIDSINEIF